MKVEVLEYLPLDGHLPQIHFDEQLQIRCQRRLRRERESYKLAC